MRGFKRRLYDKTVTGALYNMSPRAKIVGREGGAQAQALQVPQNRHLCPGTGKSLQYEAFKANKYINNTGSSLKPWSNNQQQSAAALNWMQ